MINKTNDNGDNSGGMPDDPLPDNGEKEKETLRDEDETPRGDSENERRDKHLLWVIRQQDKIIICLTELGRRIQRLECLLTAHVGEQAAREVVLALLHDLGFQPQQPLRLPTSGRHWWRRSSAATSTPTEWRDSSSTAVWQPW